MVQPRLGLLDVHASPTIISRRRKTVMYLQLPGLTPTTSIAGEPVLFIITDGMNNIDSAMHSDLSVHKSRYAEAKKTQTERKNTGTALPTCTSC
jgi:hypothetical protein